MLRKTSTLSVVVILTTCLTPAAQSQDFDLSWYTIDGGGGYSAGGDFELEGTIAQPDAGTVMTGGGFSLAGGFWAGGQMVGPPIPGDCNNDGFVDLADFALFEACLFGPSGGLGPDCGCFDFDNDGDTDMHDFAAFQLNFTGP